METKICSLCGEEKELDMFYLSKQVRYGKPYEFRLNMCKPCNHSKYRETRRVLTANAYKNAKESGASVHKLRRSKDPMSYYVSTMLASAKARSKVKGYDFELEKEWIEERISKGYCEVTGIPFDIENKDRGIKTKSPWAPSLDRRDNTKGYTKDNVQVVVWFYNSAKGESSRDEFMVLIRALAKPLFKQAIESGKIALPQPQV